MTAGFADLVQSAHPIHLLRNVLFLTRILLTLSKNLRKVWVKRRQWVRKTEFNYAKSKSNTNFSFKVKILFSGNRPWNVMITNSTPSPLNRRIQLIYYLFNCLANPRGYEVETVPDHHGYPSQSPPPHVFTFSSGQIPGRERQHSVTNRGLKFEKK